MKPSHEEHLQRLVMVIRRLDRGSAPRNRHVLFQVHDPQGALPFDLLSQRRYNEAEAVMGLAGLSPRASPPTSNRLPVDTRPPRPPAELVDSLPDDVRVGSTGARPARSARYRGGS